jgi:hypothetical protein
VERIFALVRQAVLFVLGCFVIIDAVLTSGTHVSELVVGLVLLGIVPVDAYFNRWLDRRWREP